ncbi:MAG: hypothetical protein ABIL25_09645 [candidate division WOR-3 bacterium]
MADEKHNVVLSDTGPSLTETADLLPRQKERWQALVDVLYLMQLFAVYLMSALYPFFGLFYGILFMTGGIAPKTKRIGKVCLILGIINLGICLLVGIGILVLGLTGLLAGLAKD